MDSSSTVSLLLSLSQQINFFFNDSLDLSIPTELMPLILRFKSLLNQATAQKPVFLFLDSLDQLFTSSSSYSLAWFPFNLPRHCKLVVSVPNEQSGLLKRLKKLMNDDMDNFLEILSLGRDQGIEVVRLVDLTQ